MQFEIIIRDDGLLYQRSCDGKSTQSDAPKGFGNKGVKILVQINYPGGYLKGLDSMELSAIVSQILRKAIGSSNTSGCESVRFGSGVDVEVSYTMNIGVSNGDVDFYLSRFLERIGELENFDNSSD